MGYADVVSTLALTLSLVSLTWQAWSWNRSGAVIVPVIRTAPRLTTRDGESLQPGRPTLGSVVVANTGRLSTRVTGVMGVEPGDNYRQLVGISVTPDLPCDLAPGQSLFVEFGADTIRQFLDDIYGNDETPIRVAVFTGHGQFISAPVTVADPNPKRSRWGAGIKRRPFA